MQSYSIYNKSLEFNNRSLEHFLPYEENANAHNTLRKSFSIEYTFRTSFFSTSNSANTFAL